MSITESTWLKLKFGRFKVCYHKNKNGECVSFSYGDLKNKTPIVRIHSSCLFGEIFFSKHCDCQQQLEKTLKRIKKNRSGVIIYTYAEGRGIGLEKKIKAMEIQRTQKVDTLEAFAKIGLPSDTRHYKAEIGALEDLNINKNIMVVSNNPTKIKSLKKAGYTIKKNIKIKIRLNKDIKDELLTKKNKMGYYTD